MKKLTSHPTYPSIESFAEHLTLGRCAATTKESYLRAVRRLAHYVGHDPASLEEAAVRAFLVYLKNQRYAASTLRGMAAGLKAFFVDQLGHGSWRLFELLSCPDPLQLPNVLTREQIQALLRATREPRFRTLFTLYTESDTGAPKTCQLSADEFLHRFLQHVLPTGFQRVRHFGWLHPRAQRRFLRVQTLLQVPLVLRPQGPPRPPLHLRCPRCAGFTLKIVGRLPRAPP